MPVELSLIEAHERRIGDIFDDAYTFEIPPYQRPYAWEKQQAQELLNDLLDAMDNTATSGGVYFLGSIVLIKTPNDPQSKVVDGQQRLTTLTILLSILRDLTSDPESKLRRGTYVYQKANPDSGAEERFRLLLRQQDRAFFQKCIQAPGATDALPDPEPLRGSLRNIAENAIYLRTELAKLDEKRRDALMTFIIRHSYLVVVAVPTAKAARRIFTVLNARGLDLTATDILKADLLERAGVRESDLATRWETAEQALGRDKFVELFGHIRMIYERDKPRIALEAGFPKFVGPFNGDADHFVSEILERIVDASILLGNSEEIKRLFGPTVAKAICSLDRIDNKDWVPAALLRLWKRSLGDKAHVETFFIDLERVAYFLFVTRQDVNYRIARMAAIMDEFDPRPDRAGPEEGLSLSAVEQHEFLEELSGPLYLKRRVCKPVMQRLDEVLATVGASYDQAVSIEHVLPQTVDDDSEWAKLFPDESLRDEWTHRLANLVFLTQRINIRASNWDFARKKSEYFASEDGTSPFPITTAVLQTPVWSVEHLSARQKTLIDKLAEVWRLGTSAILV